MNYKGYEASVYYSEEDECFIGEVVNIAGPTIIAFDADNVADLKKEFQESIDSYLKHSKVTKKPMSGKLTLRMNPQIHAKVVSAAKSYGISANKFINQTLEQNFAYAH